MSADVLREAAQLMRERAEAAPEGVWAATEAEGGNRDQRRTLGTFSLIHNGKSEIALVRGMSTERERIAEHIASWQPAVALAVADWLIQVATAREALDAVAKAKGEPLGQGSDMFLAQESHALTVTRAYLDAS